MSEVLSQNEIDTLLSAISSGDMASVELESHKQHIETYNFARPSKFSKDHLRTLEIIYEGYARMLSTQLPIYLRKNVQVEVISAEVITFSEFLNSSFSHAVYGIISMDPLPGNEIISMDAELAYALIERLLGGMGEPFNKNREFSDIELSIIEKILTICIDLMPDSWENVVEINPVIERVETNTQFVQMYSPNEMTALVSINVVMGDVNGNLIMCIPYTCAEPVIDRLNTKYWYSATGESADEGFRENIETTINKAYIPVRAILGKSVISVNEFTCLQRGDIIKLNTRVDDELDVIVGNIKKFKATPGASHDAYAVRVKSIIREEQ
jgi:flagellar motor switch protein FliM